MTRPHTHAELVEAYPGDDYGSDDDTSTEPDAEDGGTCVILGVEYSLTRIGKD